MRIRSLLSVGFGLLLSLGAARADFALRDGDTVVFLGDSITAARGYTKIVEHYTLMRYPQRKVRFANAGEGGDTASKCLARLDRDVFSQKPTVVIVAFGINDIGWGTKANDESKQRYLDGIRTIIERCRAHNARPVICSAAITAEDPEKAEQNYLQKMCDEGLTLAKSLGAETIDLQRGMRETQWRVFTANAKETDEKKKTRLHVPDGIHLSDLGQLAMAFAMIEGLGSTPDVSSATVDASTGAATSAAGCSITEVKKLADGVTFVRQDEGLPITLGGFSGFDFRWVPVPDRLTKYMLTVTGLEPGEYELSAEGRGLGKTSADRLARGVNITMMTAKPPEVGGPWDAQSLAVRELVDARDRLWNGTRLRNELIPTQVGSEKLSVAEQAVHNDLIALQRAVAKPYPYHFEIRKVQPKAGQ